VRQHGVQCCGIDNHHGESCLCQASWRVLCPSRGGFEGVKMATGRVGVGWSSRGPAPETRDQNPTRPRNSIRVQMCTCTRNPRGPKPDGPPETRTDRYNIQIHNRDSNTSIKLSQIDNDITTQYKYPTNRHYLKQANIA
jgi:hypothetical protein